LVEPRILAQLRYRPGEAASIAALAHIGPVPSARPPLMATLGGGAGQPNFVAAVTASGNSLRCAGRTAHQ
jgi:hypothetical protein